MLQFIFTTQLVDPSGAPLPAFFTPRTATVPDQIALREASDNGNSALSILPPAALTAARTVTFADAITSFPAGASVLGVTTSVIADLQTAQTFTGIKGFTSGTLTILDQAAGASVGTIRGPANFTGARNITFADAATTFPAGVGNVSTIMDLQTAQTITGVKTLGAGASLALGASNGITGIFMSAEITGNGTPQATAHGLGRTPTVGIAYISDNATTAQGAVSAVVSNGTTCTVTATNNLKYRILAF